jgi:hypothetical protein
MMFVLTGLWYVAFVKFISSDGKGMANEISDFWYTMMFGAPAICLLLAPLFTSAYGMHRPKRPALFWCVLIVALSPWVAFFGILGLAGLFHR